MILDYMKGVLCGGNLGVESSDVGLTGLEVAIAI